MGKVLHDERGAVVMLFVALFLPLLLAASAVALDFGAARIYRMRLQTAADAAALAAVESHDEWQTVRVSADKWVCDQLGRFGNCERGHYEDCPSFTINRVLSAVAEQEARAQTAARGCRFLGAQTVTRWNELRSNSEPEDAAWAAWAKNASRVGGVAQPSFRLIGKDSFEVATDAEQTTGFLRFFGLRRLREEVLSQARTRPN